MKIVRTVIAGALLASVVARADQIVTLKTRADVTQPYLLLAETDAKPRAVAVMFPGGQGQVRLPADISQLKLGLRGNFLVRTRGLFRDRELAVAIIDSPSDREAGMDDGFRTGRAHAEDIGAVIGDLRGRFPAAKIFLVGTSRGTLSAAYLGRSLGGAVDGVVLTSSVFQGTRRGIGLSGFDFTTIRAPLLFIHHADDGCRVPLWRCPKSRQDLSAHHGERREAGRVRRMRTAFRARLLRQGGRNRERDKKLDAGTTLSQDDRVACTRREC